MGGRVSGPGNALDFIWVVVIWKYAHGNSHTLPYACYAALVAMRML